jgi:hypothetical protein
MTYLIALTVMPCQTSALGLGNSMPMASSIAFGAADVPTRKPPNAQSSLSFSS